MQCAQAIFRAQLSAKNPNGTHVSLTRTTTMESFRNMSFAMSPATAHLWGTCALMLLGALGAGCLPRLPFLLGQRATQQQLLSVMASGLLVGAGLTVVLPEGFATFMEAQGKEGVIFPEWTMGLALLSGFFTMLLLDGFVSVCGSSGSTKGVCGSGSADPSMIAAPHLAVEDEETEILLPSSTLPPVITALQPGQAQQQQQLQRPAGLLPALQAQLMQGLPLSSRQGSNLSLDGVSALDIAEQGGKIKAAPNDVLGIITAPLCTANVPLGSGCCSAQHKHDDCEPHSSFHEPRQHHHASVGSRAGGGCHADAAGSCNRRHTSEGCDVHSISAFSSTTAASRALLGLLVHSAADGLAVGASSLSGDLALSVSVALAVLLHKGPVAFGLSSYLSSAGWPWPRVQTGLIAFSAAAPAAALATYYILSAFLVMTIPQNIALAVLFSGGTFLYAATQHILPGALPITHDHANMHHKLPQPAQVQPRNRRHLALFAASALIPLIISALVPEG